MKKNATIAITILSYFDFINEMGNPSSFTCEYENDTDQTDWKVIGYS